MGCTVGMVAGRGKAPCSGVLWWQVFRMLPLQGRALCSRMKVRSLPAFCGGTRVACNYSEIRAADTAAATGRNPLTRADEISDGPLLNAADRRGCKPGSWKYQHGRAFPE